MKPCSARPPPGAAFHKHNRNDLACLRASSQRDKQKQKWRRDSRISAKVAEYLVMPMDDIGQFDPRSADHDVNTEIPPLKKSRNPASAKKKKRITATPILHFLSTQSFASPFDVNMAVDAGYKVVVPHTGVRLDDTRALVQDAIFSRPPHYGCRTAMFIGGKDALLALDMLAVAKTSLVLTLADRPGALGEILTRIAAAGLSLTKLESRPVAHTPWQYRFYLDVLGHAAGAPVQQVLAEVQPLTVELRVLGCYPAEVVGPSSP